MQITACDLCGSTQPEVKTIEFWYDSHPDPSGNGSEDDYFRIDICFDCLVTFLKSKHIRRDYKLQPVLAEKLKQFKNNKP